jgi:hypothetical protein
MTAPANTPIVLSIFNELICGRMRKANEYKLEPLVPWRSWKTMSWFIVCAKPRAIKKVRRIIPAAT